MTDYRFKYFGYVLDFWQGFGKIEINCIQLILGTTVDQTVSVQSIIAKLPIPCLLFWGSDALLYCNDSFVRQAGRFSNKVFTKGAPARELLEDTWPVISPLIKEVLDTGRAIPAAKGMFPFMEDAFDVCDPEPVVDEAHETCGVLISFVAKEAGRTLENMLMASEERFRALADGSIGWTFSRAVPILDDGGEIIEWFGAASDITARKEIEEALHVTKDEMDTQRRLYDAITGSTPDLVYVFDLNYKFVYANRALLEMWGRNWAQSKGQGLLALGYEPWHAEMHEREIDEVVATKKPIRGEVSFPHATLGKRIYDYIFAPILNEKGDVEMIAGTTRDISELKLAEDALKQSEEQFRTLTESLPQLIWTSRPDGYCDFFNRQWYEFTGSTRETSYGDGWFSYIHPEHRSGLYGTWLESLRTGTPLVFEFQLRKADGGCQWFYVIGNPIYGQDGVIRKWVGALTNIEGHKAVEGELERLVAERTKELKRSNEDLLQFAHVASHDLKEPVRKIKTFVNRLMHDGATNLSGEGKVFIDKIESAADRMYQMIEGVLRYSTMTNLQEDIVKVDLNQVLRQIETDLEVVVQERKAGIRYTGLPVIEGAPVLIYQLFYNLVNNSLKFAKKDVPTRLTITARAVTRADTPFAVIEVADNGIGFPQDYAESIFNTFTRLNTKDRYEGTGLGLALCKKIVERHGGSIAATGAVNEGAVFSICLPLKQ